MIVECFIRLAKGFKTGFHYWPHVPVQNRLLLQALALESGHQGRIDDFRLPNAIPTISVVNNGIAFRMGAAPYFVTLLNGQINSGPDLANLIRNKLQTTTGTWKVSYDTSQMSLSINCSNEFTFTGGDFHAAAAESPLLSPRQ